MLVGDPIIYVGRAVEKPDALALTGPQEANNLHINQIHFLQVQRDVRAALPDLLLQFLQMVCLHSPNEPDGRAAPIAVLFDFQGHVRPIERWTPAQ